MKKPFRVGDRVRVTGFSSNGIDIDGTRGRINYISVSGEKADVLIDYGTEHVVYLSQLKRLVRRPKREIWITEEDIQNITSYGARNVFTSTTKLTDSDIRFIEAPVKKKKKDDDCMPF